MTTAVERTHDAIIITRTVLRKALTSPFTMDAMTWHETDPECLQDKVYEILEYLDKTKPEKPAEGLGVDTIKEGV